MVSTNVKNITSNIMYVVVFMSFDTKYTYVHITHTNVYGNKL